ncbi:Uncharacterised protein [Chryseobacterium nakagawai]|uniref:Radical SAM core domain-containing protein n=1 Tax=Chryseobacterium nakagawai TaxID=1241982 RepID=A0AAD1DPS4_CHRNA|nr:radical SAM protein [Chryseobacterium nakagawai]AZA90048.1 hypothetical protein EG343_05150 [Chryseobacterium nakagawai]VEH21490.1 Uncharacterised protein [Chryseobacterium nakagawai]
MATNYDYALSISSQISHCSLPLRLDSYSKCSFRCSYCFAKNRGGNHPPKGIKTINTKAFENIFLRLKEDNHRKNVISQFLKRKVPLHFGGMSDPFMPYESLKKKTFETLTILSHFQYPTIISTKGNLLFEEDYIDLISSGKFVIQVSFSTLNDELSKKLEVNTPLPSERLEMIKLIASSCWVSARLQPMIPGNLEKAKEALIKLASAGVKHVSVEFLKIPFIGKKKLLETINKSLNTDISKYYSDNKISGLEFLVNNDYANHFHRELIKVATQYNIQYSSADTDLLPFDGSSACCSGTAEIEGFGNYYTHTFPQAIRNALSDNSQLLTYNHLNTEWAPSGSIKRYLNSKTRIEGENNIKKFMAHKWNNATSGYGPLAFQGITDTKTFDNDGMKIFKISQEAFHLAKALKFNRFK